ncbi:MAG: hypothetical protein WAL30_03740 [Candidatus Aquirickettsiella sp.]
MVRLREAKLLTQEHFDIVKAYAYSLGLVGVLTFLKSAKFLTHQNRAIIKAGNIVAALLELNEAQLLTPENFDAVKKHDYSYSVTKVLVVLNKAQLLTQENFDLIKAPDKLSGLVAALVELNAAQLLTQQNFDAIKAHPDPASAADALVKRNGVESAIVMQENENAVKEDNKDIHFLFKLCRVKSAAAHPQDEVQENNRSSLN